MDEKNVEEFVTEDDVKKFSEVLRDAIESYVENADLSPVDKWLHNYLSEKMPDRKSEEIDIICYCIMNTITVNSDKMAEMNNALSNGQSAENWFAEDVLKSNRSTGQTAKNVTECYSELTKISNSYESEENQEEVFDVEVIPPEEWQYGNWNKYKIKEALLDTAKQAGNVAIKNTADDLYQKVTELGFKAVLSDKELIKDSLLYGKDTGLKAATAGALEIAKEYDILPVYRDPATPVDSANIAIQAIEKLKIMGKVVKGELTMAEAIVEIKNQHLAMAAGLFSEKIARPLAMLGSKIGTSIGMVFGPVGAVVGGTVGGIAGKLAGTKVGEKVISAGKKVCTAAKTVASKVCSGVKRTASKVWNGIKSFFGR